MLNCIPETPELLFYYMDGVKYLGDTSCKKIGETRECRITDCPTGYFYLHGSCTKFCENITVDLCVDTLQGNIFIKNGEYYTRIPAQACLEMGYKLAAHSIQGAVVFICLP